MSQRVSQRKVSPTDEMLSSQSRHRDKEIGILICLMGTPSFWDFHLLDVVAAVMEIAQRTWESALRDFCTTMESITTSLMAVPRLPTTSMATAVGGLLTSPGVAMPTHDAQPAEQAICLNACWWYDEIIVRGSTLLQSTDVTCP